MAKIKSLNQNNETDFDFYNIYSNSITPYEHPKRKYKQTTGCLPCQPKGYKDKDDNACCLIYWDEIFNFVFFNFNIFFYYLL